MEPGFIFTILVFSIGAIHLVRNASDLLGKWWGREQHFIPGNQSLQKRDDWYVFFHRSVLTGTSDDGSAKESKNDRHPAPPSQRNRRNPARPAARA